MTKPFQNLLGQERLKQKLIFGLESFKNGGLLPHYLFVGARGCGKTFFAKELARSIHVHDKGFQAHLINCATLKSVKSFYEQIYEQKIVNRKCILLFDEAHNLPDILQQLFLTTIEVDDKVERVIPTESGDMTINMRNHIFMFMSSEPDRLFAPLKDRMEIVSLAAYKIDELSEIVARHAKDVKFDDGVLAAIAESLRGHPRDAVKTAKGIVNYCIIQNRQSFSSGDWAKFTYLNNVKPYGLNDGEIQILRVLAQNGECSLNDLRGATGISRTAIMNDLEPYLLYRHFIRIDGKRKITNKGREAWKFVEQEI